MNPAYPSYEVKYHGFVYVDKPSGGLPDPSAIQNAAVMLKTKKKQARQQHPLFARGFDTTLSLQALPSGLLVTAEQDGGNPAVVMNNPMHKLAYVVDIGTCTIFLVKREGKGKFKCHSFDAGSSEKAQEIAAAAAEVCNQLFRRVRKSIRRVSKRGGKLPSNADADADADAREVSKLAAVKEDEVKKMFEEPDEPEEAAEVERQTKQTSAGTGTSNIEFIDGVSDQLANLMLGDAPAQDKYTEVWQGKGV